jgi:hypothetical protein
MVAIHHPVTGATVDVPAKALAAHLKRGWVEVSQRAVPKPAAPKPAAPVAAAAPATIAAPPIADPSDADERALLLELADELGVYVDRRWGVARLNEALAAYQGDENTVPEGDDNTTPSQED